MPSLRYFRWILTWGILISAGRLSAESGISRDEVEARAILAKHAKTFEGFTDEEAKLAEAANMQAMKAVSIETVRTFLAKDVALADVLKTFGLPFHVSLQEHEGVLWYRLPDRGDLRFWFQGNAITGASYGGENIKGVARVNAMRVEMKPTGTVTYVARFFLNDEGFDTMDAFQKRLQKLPSGAVVVWQMSCLSMGNDEPLRTEEEQKAFKEFCREAGVRLIVRAAG